MPAPNKEGASYESAFFLTAKKRLRQAVKHIYYIGLGGRYDITGDDSCHPKRSDCYGFNRIKPVSALSCSKNHMAGFSHRHQVVILSEITRYAAVGIELYQQVLLPLKGNIYFGICIIKAIRYIYIYSGLFTWELGKLVNVYPAKPV